MNRELTTTRLVITLIVDVDASTALNILRRDLINAVVEMDGRVIACELEEV